MHLVPSNLEFQPLTPHPQIDMVDAAGSAVQGDLSAMRGSDGATANAPAAQDASTGATAAAPPAAAPAAAPTAAAPDPHAAAKHLQEITGQDLDACVEALRHARGSVDAAAARMLGF